MSEGVLRLGLNNFQSKVERGEAGRGSVAAEERWVGGKNLNAVLPSRWQMLQKYLFRGSFILFENHVGICRLLINHLMHKHSDILVLCGKTPSENSV